MSNNGAVHQEVTTIPDMDGTGPRWLGERKFFKRGWWNQPDNNNDIPGSSEQKPEYGIGRGGLPRGCGRRMSKRWN